MLNSLALGGHVEGDVQLVFEENKKTHKATFRLVNITDTDKRVYENSFNVVVYGQKALQCSKRLTAGSKVSVCGKVNIVIRTDDAGHKTTNVVVNASEVFFD